MMVVVHSYSSNILICIHPAASALFVYVFHSDTNPSIFSASTIVILLYSYTYTSYLHT